MRSQSKFSALQSQSSAIRRLATSMSFVVLSLVALMPGANAEGISSKFLDFGDPSKYGDGDQISAALHSSGLVLEFHKGDVSDGIHYRVGMINANGKGVSWGPSRAANLAGYWPTVALNKEGYVVLVRSLSESRAGSELFYRIGKINPSGDIYQMIEWKTDTLHWDGGFHSSIAINDNGVIVGVHESNSTSNNNLHYRVGHLVQRGGSFFIEWDSGHYGIRYDSGQNPHIALNNHNEVIELHQVTNETLLHYRRGTVKLGDTGAAIDFGTSQRYDRMAWHPAVALLDNGLALAVHIDNDVTGWSLRTGECLHSATLCSGGPPAATTATLR
jgi:hypothetical protein